MAKSVDVIVPCFRYGHFLNDCVESILTRQDVDVRILIIDDASPDNTQDVGEALARGDGRVTFRRHAVNRGHIATYNEGIEWASADYLLLLSADDYLLPHALGRACKLMDDRPDIGFTFGNAVILHPGDRTEAVFPLGSRDEPAIVMSGADFAGRSGAFNIVPTPTAVVRTTLQKRVGGYRPELPHSGDMEMWLRLASHAAVGFINADQGVYRRHDANMSLAYAADNMLSDLRERRKALAMFFDTGGQPLAGDAGLRGMLLRSLARHAVGRASMAFNAGSLEAADAIAAFALEVSPDVARTWPWAKLACKRTVGHAGWRAVSSAKATLLGRVQPSR